MIKQTMVPVLLAIVTLYSSCRSDRTLKAVQAEADGLKTQNLQLQKSVSSLKSENANLSQQNAGLVQQGNAAAEAMASYRTQCEENQRKLAMIQTMLRAQYDNLQQAKAQIDKALEDFEGKGVEVYYKNGLLYVSLEDDLLYKSGSAKLDNKGKQALGSLAAVLNDYPKLKLIVLGNTDNVQFKKGSDNWSLSTERANGVVRIFRDDYKIDPVRLTAAGKAKYNPVADNGTAAGRAKNRRTDIIINPDLEKVWELIAQ